MHILENSIQDTIQDTIKIQDMCMFNVYAHILVTIDTHLNFIVCSIRLPSENDYVKQHCSATVL